jgi:hypothetical protein
MDDMNAKLREDIEKLISVFILDPVVTLGEHHDPRSFLTDYETDRMKDLADAIQARIAEDSVRLFGEP